MNLGDGDPEPVGDPVIRGSLSNDPATLKQTYERVCHERDRLRGARGFFSRPLGPAPASAGISTALVGAFSSHLDTAR